MLICKLCLIKIESSDHSTTISEDEMVASELCFPGTELLTLNDIICNYCKENLMNLYNFKKRHLNLDNLESDTTTCRICQQDVYDREPSIKLEDQNNTSKSTINMLKACFPSLKNINSSNLELLKCCLVCWNDLQASYYFLTMCLENHNYNSILSNPLEHTELVKTEVLDIKSEFVNEDENDESLCKICSFQAKTRATLARHILIHIEPKFQCPYCPYKGRRKDYLKLHLETAHDESDPSNKDNNTTRQLMKTGKFPCTKCSYKARTKHALNYHQLLHPKSDADRFACPKCPYKGKRIDYLKSHMLVHADDSGSKVNKTTLTHQWFQCVECSYKTKRKHDLRYHMIVHREPKSDADLYCCRYCTYKTKREKNLKRHDKNHSKEERESKIMFEHD